jgi:hypothetical protein
MDRDDPRRTGNTLPRVSFRVVLGRQWVCVPFLGPMLFFGLLGLPHYSPEDERALLLAVACIPALGAAGRIPGRPTGFQHSGTLTASPPCAVSL